MRTANIWKRSVWTSPSKTKDWIVRVIRTRWTLDQSGYLIANNTSALAKLQQDTHISVTIGALGLCGGSGLGAGASRVGMGRPRLWVSMERTAVQRRSRLCCAGPSRLPLSDTPGPRPTLVTPGIREVSRGWAAPSGREPGLRVAQERFCCFCPEDLDSSPLCFPEHSVPCARRPLPCPTDRPNSG